MYADGIVNLSNDSAVFAKSVKNYGESHEAMLYSFEEAVALHFQDQQKLHE